MITCDKDPLADSELKRKRGSESDLLNSSWIASLSLSEGKDFCGVNLKNWGVADSLDESMGKVGGSRKEAAGFQDVHR